MAVSYKWLIGDIIVNDEGSLKDVIKKIYWNYEGQEDSYSAVANRCGYIDFGIADPNNFKPFSEFSRQEIEIWLENNVPNINELKENIEEKIIELKNKPKSKPAPWL